MSLAVMQPSCKFGAHGVHMALAGLVHSAVGRHSGHATQLKPMLPAIQIG